MNKEIGSNGQEEDGKKKKSVLARVLTIIIIILLLLALIVCLIIIFTHRHTMTYYSATAATCTADGNEEFWYCAGCERYFADEEGNTEIEYTDAVIPAAGHTWVGASCDSPRHCSVCGFSDGVALGHDFGEYVSDNNATCTADGTQTATCSRCGETDTKILSGSALGHSYGANLVVSADCIHNGSITRVCTVCGNKDIVSIPALGVHDWQWDKGVVTPATSTSEGMIVYPCADCDEVLIVIIPVTGEHNWQFDKGEVTAQPTCTADGSIEYPCADCDEILQLTVPANASAHSWGAGEVTEPTCTAEGKVVFTCEHCGDTLEVALDSLGHKWIEATCTAPKTCAVCGATEGEALGHDWQDATCTAPKTCAVCGTTEGEALGHTYKDEVTDANCVTAGSVTRTCTVCGDEQIITIPATGVHEWIEATCTAPKTCAVCGATEGTALGHKWSDWTAYSDVHMRECETCGISEVKAHDFTTGDTCSVCNAEKPKPAGGSDNVAEITIESDYYYYGSLDTDLADYYAQYTGSLNGLNLNNYELPLSSRIFDPAGTLISDYNIKFTAETELNLSVSMPNNFVDTYVSAYNSSGVTIEYHPVRFTLYIANDAGEYEAVSNLSYLSMEEFIAAFNSVKPFDDVISAGEVVDISFRIEAAWAEYIEEPDYFEIIGSDGNVYKFADSATYSSKWYLSFLDTAIGELSPGREDYSWATTCDSTGGVWTINYEDSYSYDFCYAIDINITQS